MRPQRVAARWRRHGLGDITRPGKIEPLVPEWPKIGDATITAVQEGFSGIKTPEQALKDLHIATNRILGVQ